MTQRVSGRVPECLVVITGQSCALHVAGHSHGCTQSSHQPGTNVSYTHAMHTIYTLAEPVDPVDDSP